MDRRDEELYEKYADELIRFATTLVGPSRAEDVVADAVVRAMTSPAWVSVSAPKAYLFRSVLNEAKMLGRGNGRRVRRERLVAGAETTDAVTISIEVREAMAQLSMRERSVLYLAYWHDLPIDEIAETLGISKRSTERSLTDARRTLEERLA